MGGGGMVVGVVTTVLAIVIDASLLLIPLGLKFKINILLLHIINNDI